MDKFLAHRSANTKKENTEWLLYAVFLWSHNGYWINVTFPTCITPKLLSCTHIHSFIFRKCFFLVRVMVALIYHTVLSTFYHFISFFIISAVLMKGWKLKVPKSKPNELLFSHTSASSVIKHSSLSKWFHDWGAT